MRSTRFDAAKGFTSKQGFTIVELLIVVVVIAILASITIVSYGGITKSANNAAIQTTLSQAANKLEIYRMNGPTGLFPVTLASAGLDLVSDSSTTYTYAASGDGALYCLSSSKAGRTYYVTNTATKPQTGTCTGTVGTAGTGNVAVDGASTAPAAEATKYSVFNSTLPGGATQVIGNDGGGSLKVGNRFYTTEATGIKVVGLRLYNPTSGDAGFLALGVTAYAYLQDWTGSALTGSSSFGLTPAATKSYTTTRVAGAWTDIMFDAPLTLAPISSAAGSSDVLTLVVQYATGIHYIVIGPANDAAVQSTLRPGTYMAELGNLGKGINTLVPSNVYSTNYGIDVIYNSI